ncbi:MAG: translation initiation factor IF-2 [Oscillospiraceae bacterium]|nr:translation initiation factor IF-2 [Oscillospiraceae bacterium]
MSEERIIKVGALAKDLQAKPKDIITVLKDQTGIVKTTSASLDEKDVNVILDWYSKKTQIPDIDKYLKGELYITSPAAERARAEKAAAAEKAEADKVAEEKAAAEKAVADKAEADRAAAEKAAADKAAAEKAALQLKSEKQSQQIQHLPQQNTRKLQDHPNRQNEFPKTQKGAASVPYTDNSRRSIKQSPDRFVRPTDVKKAAEQKKENKKPSDNHRIAPIIPAPGTPTTVVTAKRDLRIIDTRSNDVDLSKYDERIYDIAGGHEDSNAAHSRRSSQNRPGQRPGFKKGKPAKNTRRQEPVRAKAPSVIHLPEELSVSDLARELRIKTGDVLKKLISGGFMANLNSAIDFETAQIIADEYGVTAEKEHIVTIEEKLIDTSEDKSEKLIPRSPVVVVMGHVDHGKTSLLDAIRHTNVTEGEAGGITQHIGAYRVKINGKEITFLDTPGHAAFTSMRARGAQVTDIAVLVVAADDGIMPQTIEAINHAKAAGVSIIVAINKMDKRGANPDAVMQELTKYDLVPEEWGGDVICVPVSAVTKMGIDKLLESILLVAEMAELKANPNRLAKGVVIEAKLDKGRGPVATMLIQNGTLHNGDIIIAGSTVGKVRAMLDDKGATISEAGPSVPVEILGLSEVPNAGDIVNAVEDERMARTLADQRRAEKKEDEFRSNAKVSLNDLFNQIKEGIKELNIIVKADVQGSAEAVKASLEKISNDEVRVHVIHSGVGGITESDVMLASASNAIIVGFNVRPDKNASDLASRDSVDLRTYRIIYECIGEIEAAMKGLLAPKFVENVIGRAEVRQTIRVPNIGIIAGSYVLDGKVTRNAQIRVLRDNIVIFEDKISSLRRFKDDAKEVATGYECGIALERFSDIKEGDILEAFIMEEIAK